LVSQIAKSYISAAVLLLIILGTSYYTGVPEVRDSIHDTDKGKASSNK